MKQVQALCQNGHYNPNPKGACSVCGAPIVWRNEVDDTNYDDYGAVPLVECLLITPIVGSHATYRIPTPEETVSLAARIDDEGDLRFIASGKLVRPILLKNLSVEKQLMLCLAFIEDHDLMPSLKGLNQAEIDRLFTQYDAERWEQIKP